MKTEETIKLIKYVTGSVAAVLLAAAPVNRRNCKKQAGEDCREIFL